MSDVACVTAPILHQRRHLLRRRERHGVLADDGDGRRLAAADAWRVQHPDVLAEHAGQRLQQVVRPGEVAGNRVADAHGDRGRRGVAFLDHVEVVVEGRHLVDLGHRHLHLVGERHQVGSREMAEAVLDLVQVLDQEVPSPGLVAEQHAHVFTRLRIDPAAFRRGLDALALAFRFGCSGQWLMFIIPYRRRSPRPRQSAVLSSDSLQPIPGA